MKFFLRKSLSLTMLNIVFSIIVFAQQSDCERMNLNGKIKSMKETFKTITWNSGSEVKDSIEFYYINEYNTSGNKTSDTKYQPDGKVIKKYSYIYDKEEKRQEQKQFLPDGKILLEIYYKYDSKGILIEDYGVKGDGKPDKTMKYIYDDQGNVVEDNSFNADGILQKRFTYKYDNRGNKVENCRFSANGDLEKKIILTYDIQNNATEEYYYKADNTIITRIENKYKYDTLNNWIEKIQIADGKLTTVIERLIEYYP